MTDPYDLQRFVVAQEHDGTFDRALGELRAARKTSHWMWFVFPQVAGLGRSPTAQRFAISGLPEAVAYLEHPVLAPRLVQCAQALVDGAVTDATAALGSVDAQKLRSSMTLFALAAPEQPLFRQVLLNCFGGIPDAATTALVTTR